MKHIEGALNKFIDQSQPNTNEYYEKDKQFMQYYQQISTYMEQVKLNNPSQLAKTIQDVQMMIVGLDVSLQQLAAAI